MCCRYVSPYRPTTEREPMKRLQTTRRRHDARVHPIPGALKPGDWTITEGPGATDLRKRKMSTPVAASEATRQIQLHEMAHVRWTPTTATPGKLAKQWDTSEDVIQGVEDSRLTQLLAREGLPQDIGFIEPDDQGVLFDIRCECGECHGSSCGKKVKVGRTFCDDCLPAYLAAMPPAVRRKRGGLYAAMENRDQTVGILAATWQTGDHDTVREFVSTYGDARLVAVVDTALSTMVSDPSDHAGYTGELVGRIRDTMEALRLPPEAPVDGGSGGSGSGPRSDFRAAGRIGGAAINPEAAAVELAEAEPGEPEAATGQEVVAALKPLTDFGGSLAEAATGEIVPADANLSTRSTEAGWRALSDRETAPMSARMKRGKIPRGKACHTEAGAVPVAMHRLTSDGRPFRGMKSKEGAAGAVLIDVSGSMRLTPDQVAAIVAVIPAGIIACYSGPFLTIIGNRGKCCNEDELAKVMHVRAPGSNESDGPALRWLAEQRGPRFWICDGHVTYRGDSYAGPEGQTECLQICLRSRILRVDGVAEVIERYSRKGREHRRR